MPLQLEPISSSRVLRLIEADETPFSDSSTIQKRSPSWNECDCTLFELIVEYVPLPNFGLSP